MDSLLGNDTIIEANHGRIDDSEYFNEHSDWIDQFTALATTPFLQPNSPSIIGHQHKNSAYKNVDLQSQAMFPDSWLKHMHSTRHNYSYNASGIENMNLNKLPRAKKTTDTQDTLTTLNTNKKKSNIFLLNKKHHQHSTSREYLFNKKTQFCLIVLIHYILRILSILSTYFLSLLVTLYGLTQLLDISAIDFFCPTYSKDEVYYHNYISSNPQGSGGCWYVDTTRVDSSKLWNDMDVVQWIKIENITFDIIIFSFIFFSSALIMFCFASWHFCIMIYDSIYQCSYYVGKTQYNRNPRLLRYKYNYDNTVNRNGGVGKGTVVTDYIEITSINLKPEDTGDIDFRYKSQSQGDENDDKNYIQQSHMLWCKNICPRLTQLYEKYDRISFVYFYPDSKYTMYLSIMSETTETAFQISTLLQYSGVFGMYIYHGYIKFVCMRV